MHEAFQEFCYGSTTSFFLLFVCSFLDEAWTYTTHEEEDFLFQGSLFWVDSKQFR